MKYLKDYTTEELKEELKRRQKEERIKRLSASRKTEYAYITGIVRYIYKHAPLNRKYCVEISKEDCLAFNISDGLKERYASIDVKINAADRPRPGETVRLRSRKTKSNPTGVGHFSNFKIIEVIRE